MVVPVPIGSVLARRYYAVPDHYSIGEEFADAGDAAVAALERWAAVDTDLPITPPVVDERWVMTSPANSGAMAEADFTVERTRVAPHLTGGQFADRQARRAAAVAAIGVIRDAEAAARDAGHI